MQEEQKVVKKQASVKKGNRKASDDFGALAHQGSEKENLIPVVNEEEEKKGEDAKIQKEVNDLNG